MQQMTKSRYLFLSKLLRTDKKKKQKDQKMGTNKGGTLPTTIDNPVMDGPVMVNGTTFPSM